MTDNQPKITVLTDPVADLLDDMADLFECWKKWRSKGHNHLGLRSALICLADHAVLEFERQKTMPTADIERLLSGAMAQINSHIPAKESK